MAVKVLTGDCRTILPTLPEKSVHCCVTSPPYFGLRDYGTATWEGGDAGCDHMHRTGGTASSTLGEASGGHAMSDEARVQSTTRSFVPYRDRCGRCGAVRVDKQLGLEPIPDCLAWARGEPPCDACYVCALRTVFAAVKRVLRDDGTLWVVIGDSYAGSNSAGYPQSYFNGQGWSGDRGGAASARRGTGAKALKPPPGLKAKDLIMVPARLALALQSDGWYLRMENVWHKRSCMPESVTDRTTRSHEMVYVFSKSARYYYDAEAVKEPMSAAGIARYAYDFGGPKFEALHEQRGLQVVGKREPSPTGRNLRSVWSLSPEPFAGGHYGVFPTEIPKRAILAGTSERGCCPTCGAGWARIIERTGYNGAGRADETVYTGLAYGNPQSAPRGPARNFGEPASITTGWRPACSCPPAEPVPAVVLDPFAGAGTTLLVADRLGRDGIGIELNHDYASMSARRVTGDAPLFARVDTA
jgi:DNA modification methylase